LNELTGGITVIAAHDVVPHEAWLEARIDLLAREKEFTRLRDELAERRRALPWEEVEETYVFDGPEGERTLGDLFDGRSQLIVYHFMYPADWDAGCSSCSFWADNFDPIIVHLNARDVTMVAVSRAPLAKLIEYRRRMGWSFGWFSSAGNDFNRDLGVGFTPEEAEQGGFYNYRLGPTGPTEREGMSVFFKDDTGRIFHTYSAYARGIDLMNTAYNYLDTVPKGRDEGGRPLHWVRRHDEYAS
jgi:predicted dithiol-disulfide oxidoreductase (DUF899 family)